MIKRLWTETEPFDFDGRHVHLAGAFANPKPVQQPHPPILIAGRTARVLRVVAEHADVWNIAGYTIEETKARSALLDRYCAEIGRDPASITRSTSVRVDYEDPDRHPGHGRRGTRRRLYAHRAEPRRPLPRRSRLLGRRQIVIPSKR